MEPKITDFGLSRSFDGRKSTILTINIFGTMGYIAPELLEKGQISPKSDIYSLGIIVTKLILGSNEIITENVRRNLIFIVAFSCNMLPSLGKSTFFCHPYR
ncbi:hypothetical protein PR202_gb15932 [Eleusine coracana subsp. coracana]|uniref:Protein kinase domain-containing protein n=1 Tax=Eleusine coracana subsp. coracana TaxID=191504 RepID=A0AAV5EZ42_ELECO|nr:hypothetical protein PR202_gb15932 [Eleusine coracana subsp. coracana]